MLSALLALSLACPGAYAEDWTLDRSIDTQLVHPAPGPQAAVTVDDPRADLAGTVTAGLAWQYERAPLDYYLDGELGGAAIAWRQTVDLGVSVAVSRRGSLSLAASGALQEGGDLAAVAPASPLALGDVSLAWRSAWVDRPLFGLGPSLGVYLPVGTREAWFAERRARWAPALLVAWGGERLRLLGQTGFLTRASVDSGADLVAAPEIVLGAALLASATPWLGGLVEISSRHGLTGQGDAGGAHPAEVLGGLRLRAGRFGRLDLLGGTGIGHGYGAGDLRLMASVKGSGRPRRRGAPDLVLVPSPNPPLVRALPEPTPAVQPRGAAWIDHGQLELAAAVAFEPGTATLLPDAKPLLAAVAALVNSFPQLELLVVEGHAAGAGSPAADYALSAERARVVFEQLVALSVRPARLAWRGMGDTDPAGLGGRDGADFVITRIRALQDGPVLDEGDPIVLPWNGEQVPAPVLGDGLLSPAGNPILRRVVPEGEAEALPSGATFRDAIEGDEPDDAPEGAEEAPE
ncbi:MAG: OmpA family protein [Pseudomonadota bacterium]